MVVLHHGGGAQDFELLDGSVPASSWRSIRDTAAELLRIRNDVGAARLLREVPFVLRDGINSFGDEFLVLYAQVPMDQYEELRRSKDVAQNRTDWQLLADTLSEIRPYVRFVCIEPALTSAPQEEGRASDSPRRGLSPGEVLRLMNDYIGVSGWYLGDFETHRSHKEFYAELDLDVDPDRYQGTIRERFAQILKESPPEVQATILEGILRRYPLDSEPRRTNVLYGTIEEWISRIRMSPEVRSPDLRTSSGVVRRVLRDAEELICKTGATSAVDRMHTALHGYLKEVCDQAGIEANANAGINQLFRLIREHHPAFRDTGARPQDTQRIMDALGTAINALDPLRNRASVAHPNEQLLAIPEALLVTNAIRTILQYLDARLHPESWA